MNRIDATLLKARLRGDAELALLDVREEGVFAKAHLLYASSLPLSRLELKIRALVPRDAAPIVLCDGADGLAERAADRLREFGYRDIAVLVGGVDAWRAQGFELFSGVHVPSKAFGEVVEHEAGTPHIEARDLGARLAAGEDILILDSRPLDEFRRMSIPGALDCPGAELVHRVHEVVPSPKTLVVVNCAGRTRSIIGAQSLIDSGLPNPVMALKNGTMGWHLAGLELARGETRHAPPPRAAALAKAQAAARVVAARHGVAAIDAAGLERFRDEAAAHTLYIFDVRAPDEYARGHLPGARSAPGGQLVQATDGYIGTLNARIVLVDSEGVRAAMTGAWLKRMGWKDVFTFAADPARLVKTGPERSEVPGLARWPSRLAAPELAAALGTRTIVDLDTSLAYRDGHIPGAWFAIRARLAQGLAKLPRGGGFVLTSRDGVLAELAAPELARLASEPVFVLDGGTEAWRAQGLALAQGEEHMADLAEDAWYRPYDRGAGVEAAMNEYLRWEVGLVEQVRRDGDARFL